jgi:transposase
MSHTAFWLGIDVAKAEFVVELLGSAKPRTATFKNRPDGFAKLAAWLAKWKAGRVHACLEATGGYERALAHALVDAGHLVSIVNPARIRGQAQSELKRAKTDPVDAGVIARFCREKQPEAWTPPPPEVEHLQALLARLDDLQGMRVAEANRLATAPDLTTRESVELVLKALDAEIARIRAEIDRHVDTHPDLKRDRELLDSIPGIGPGTATFLLSLRLRRFGSSRGAVAFLGLAPRPHESGTSVRGRARLCKMGSTRGRSALYWPAIAAALHCEAFADLRRRLLERGKPKMVAIAACMRKLVSVAYGVLKSGQPFDPTRAAARL